MKQFYIIAILSVSILASCKSGPKDLEPFMLDISEFKINNELLKDGDYVEILGSSGNLTEEHKIDFYNLVVVRSERTGDTVNVLVTNFFQSEKYNPRTRFMSNSSLMGKLFENTSEPKKLNNSNINQLKAKTYKKVFYDSEYIQVDVRHFPSVTGNLGDYNITGDIPIE